MRVVILHPRSPDGLSLNYLMIRLRTISRHLLAICAEENCTDAGALSVLRECEGIVVCDGEWTRPSREVARLVAESVREGRPLMVLGRGVKLLSASDALCGRLVSAPADLALEVEEAGASWYGGPIAVDGNLVSVAELHALEKGVREFVRLLKCYKLLGRASEALWLVARTSDLGCEPS